GPPPGPPGPAWPAAFESVSLPPPNAHVRVSLTIIIAIPGPLPKFRSRIAAPDAGFRSKQPNCEVQTRLDPQFALLTPLSRGGRPGGAPVRFGSSPVVML